MTEKKRSTWTWLNPLTWLEAALGFFAAIFGPLLRWLGMLTPPSVDGFANTQVADVDDAKKLAEEREAAVDALTRDMSPAEVVKAYARADAAGRASMDLSVLGMEDQDWLLSLSDEDLDKLGMCTLSGCARSLENKEVLPIYARPQPEMEAPEVLQTPSADEIEEMKREFVSARFRELYYAPGIPNPNPRFASETRH